MIIVFAGIEIIASFIEMFVLYKIYYVLLHNQCRSQKKIIDILFALGGTVIIEICNHVSLFSYFTILIFVLYTSISAAFIYKKNYIFLFSIASFYILCLSCFDFMLFTLVASFYGGYETFVKLVSTMGPLRMIMIVVIKIFLILV